MILEASRISPADPSAVSHRPLNSMIVAPGQTVASLDQISGKSVGVTGIPSDDAFYTTMLKTSLPSVISTTAFSDEPFGKK